MKKKLKKPDVKAKPAKLSEEDKVTNLTALIAQAYVALATKTLIKVTENGPDERKPFKGYVKSVYCLHGRPDRIEVFMMTGNESQWKQVWLNPYSKIRAIEK